MRVEAQVTVAMVLAAVVVLQRATAAQEMSALMVLLEDLTVEQVRAAAWGQPQLDENRVEVTQPLEQVSIRLV
jgi:hypothetical protein